MDPKATVVVTCKVCNITYTRTAQGMDRWQGSCRKCSRDYLRRRPIAAPVKFPIFARTYRS